jgi:4-hydroxy-tetrahydrodipicolinate synthase
MGGRFGELITAMVTPFDAVGEVDLKRARDLASWLIDHGSDGLVVTGSTGEAATMTDREKIALWEAVKDQVADRWVIAGTGTNDTARSIQLTKAAEEAGVDGALVVTPYYNRPPQSGLVAHFSAVAGSTELPILLYDIPVRSGIKIEHSTLIRLAGVDNIVGVKDACGNLQGASRLVAETPESFQVYCGNDGDTLGWLAVGAVGVIAVASHVAGPRMAEMIRLFNEGDSAGARKIHLELMPVFDAMAIATNPIPVKAALGLMGHPVGDARSPLVPATQSELNRLKEVLSEAGIT